MKARAKQLFKEGCTRDEVAVQLSDEFIVSMDIAHSAADAAEQSLDNCEICGWGSYNLELDVCSHCEDEKEYAEAEWSTYQLD